MLARLESAGHDVLLQPAPGMEAQDAALGAILALEGKRAAHSLAKRWPQGAGTRIADPDLVIDLTGRRPSVVSPTLSMTLNGQVELAPGLAAVLAGGLQPELVVRLDREIVGTARPMLGDRVWLGRIANDILAAAITLIETSVARFAVGNLVPVGDGAGQAATQRPRGLVASYLPHLLAGLGRRALAKLGTRRPFYWRTAYRLIDGTGVADTNRLDGASFRELPDDGTRFYADPFVFEWQDRTYLFVEDYSYRMGKGLISVAELGPDGKFETPRPVIEERHHLSYPQVFAHDGEIYMIPESSGAGEVVLYRATHFPDAWTRAAVLIGKRQLNDMTLLERDGRFWLVGTEQVGQGSASDTMVVWSAPALEGPWAPHPLNPICIDRSAARPGGRFIVRDGRTFLPVQDGTRIYGGGLGLVELLELSETEVRFGQLTSIAAGPAWNRSGIHTLDRSGRLEVVDSAG